MSTLTLLKTAFTYQPIDGFGFALTGGSAMLINKMSESGRAKLLKELFTLQE
jgi:glucosylceramidase